MRTVIFAATSFFIVWCLIGFEGFQDDPAFRLTTKLWVVGVLPFVLFLSTRTNKWHQRAAEGYAVWKRRQHDSLTQDRMSIGPDQLIFERAREEAMLERDDQLMRRVMWAGILPFFALWFALGHPGFALLLWVIAGPLCAGLTLLIGRSAAGIPMFFEKNKALMTEQERSHARIVEFYRQSR